jgi:clathrin heavy chain
VLENWLDSRVAEGNQLPAVHNSLAKIKIDTNQDPQSFLINNQYYDSLVVGKYCEERDPHLAYTAYKRAWGQCDMELIEVTNKNSLYRLQARYLVERQSKELWNTVLSADNPHRKAIIEQVVSAALPDSKNVEEVSCAVQAFLAAELHGDLISLLEKIVLHNSEFGQYKKLQNLLIITAIKTDKTRVMDYINRLDNYDGPEIAKIALGEQYQLYEEAFVIFKKSGLVAEAIEVLLNNIESISRAAEFAEKTNLPEVWSKLAHAYLEKFQVSEAIDSYMKANDPTCYMNVITAAENESLFEPLIKYLLMARNTIKDVLIDNGLCYAYAKIEKLAELENFISSPNSSDIQRVGDRCYDEKLYEAARILFTSIKNNARIASCLVRLKQFQKAIDAAKKANTPRTW